MQQSGYKQLRVMNSGGKAVRKEITIFSPEGQKALMTSENVLLHRKNGAKQKWSFLDSKVNQKELASARTRQPDRPQ